jgi:hypothetical protein
MYAGTGGKAPAGPNQPRDVYLQQLIQTASRRFEQECGRDLNGFAPLFEPRIFSGLGAQMLDVDDFAAIQKVEYDLTPGQNPSWEDITPYIATGELRLLPIRYWPKNRLFYMNTFVTDPYQYGNVRVTAVWGTVIPDLDATPPELPYGTGSYQLPNTEPGITALAALGPFDADANPLGGWWITPEDVTDVVAKWVVYMFKQGQAGYAVTKAGGQASTVQAYPGGVPDFVQEVVDNYAEGMHPQIAMITSDGVDIAIERIYGPGQGNPMSVSRWAGWMTTAP